MAHNPQGRPFELTYRADGSCIFQGTKNLALTWSDEAAKQLVVALNAGRDIAAAKRVLDDVIKHLQGLSDSVDHDLKEME